MLLADITISTEAMVVIGACALALTGAITYLFTTLKESYEKQLTALNSDRNSWKEMTMELGINLEKAVNRKRAKEGKPPFEATEDVIAEHNSPTTRQQQETANISTMRARLVKATKELEMEPRVAAEQATDKEEVRISKEAPGKAIEDANALIEKKKNLDEALHDASKATEIAHDAVDEAAQISKDQ